MTSLVFPTYNPGTDIDRIWAAVRKFVRTQADSWEILFVCDGCSDDTPARLSSYAAAADFRVKILSYSPNRGKGYAVRTGFAAARGQWRIFTDVDLAYSFEDIVRVADELKRGAGLVVASRNHPESIVLVPEKYLGYAYRRRQQSRLFGTLVRTLLPITVSDTQAGLKGLSAELAQAVLPHLHCEGFSFDCELLTACARIGLKATTVPVCVKYENTVSTTGATTTLRMVGDLWRTRQRWRGSMPPADPTVIVNPPTVDTLRVAA